MTTPNDEVRAALKELVDWLADPLVEQWSYVEGGMFYEERTEQLTRARRALAAAPTGEGKLRELNGEHWARLFHDTYEKMAPAFGYETRADTKAFDPTTPNGRLMTAVCGYIAGVMQDALAAPQEQPHGK